MFCYTLNSHLYYTDWGAEAKVVRSNLDGSGATTILSNGLENPNSVVFSAGAIYVVDSRFKSAESGRKSNPALYVNESGSWKPMEQNQMVVRKINGILLFIKLFVDSLFSWHGSYCRVCITFCRV